MTTEMKMETRSLASLRPAEYNPRVQLQPADPEYQNIKRSIETFGYVDPIIINQDGTIIGGHQRYNVMKDLGYTEAQVVVVDLDKNNEKALNIALNKITDLITYINQIIAQYKDQTTVLFEKKPTKNDVHPTMKPVNLVGRLMRNSSKPGWNVLDLFGGSGSTLMAAEQIGRRAFLMELDEKFCDVIVHRWEEFTGKKAVRAGKLEVSL